MNQDPPAHPPPLPPPARAPLSAPVTVSLIVINVAVFAAMAAGGVGLLWPDAEPLVKWGAGYAPLTTSGQWWRLLTSAFIHVGALHLLINMWALNSLGRLVERLYGSVPFAALYLVSALTGSLGSLFGSRNTVSAGASGAIFGVMGGLAAFLFTHRGVIRPGALKALRSSVVSVIGFNLAAGFAIPFIDNRAHIGGLLGGALAGLAAGSFRARQPHAPASSAPLIRIVAAGAVMAGALAAVAPRVDGGRTAGIVAAPGDGEFRDAWSFLQQEESRLNAVHEDLVRRKDTMRSEELARLYEEQVAAGWDAVAARFEALPPEARERDPDLVRLVALRRDVARALVEATRTRQPAAIDRYNALSAELQGRLEARRKAAGAQPAAGVSP